MEIPRFENASVLVRVPARWSWRGDRLDSAREPSGWVASLLWSI